MNLREFIFYFGTVFGTTGVILAWQYLMYSIDQKENKDERRVDFLP
tara:strand:+ start:168 stop:305 length:138 start_codon:yes stop_codon:yes gene_type:complete